MTTDEILGPAIGGAVGSCSGTANGVGGHRVRLSSCHVRWSSADAAFVAQSDQHPGLIYRDRWSSLAAMDGLLEVIEGIPL